MSGRRSILVVHGRDFKPARETHIDATRTALRWGIERDYPDVVDTFDSTHVEFAYYGDLSNELLAGLGERYDEDLDVRDRDIALAALKAIPTRKRFGIRQYDRLPGKSALGEFMANLVSPLLNALGLWMWLCKRNARDYYEYLRGDKDYADKVRQRVREKLLALLTNGDRVLLLTHGTGSAISWDVLWELSHDEKYAAVADRRVEMFVTLGSPLGDRGLQKRLFGARGKGLDRFPKNIVTWHNVSAEDDYTCHDSTLADDFRYMLKKHIVSGLDDHVIYNHAVRYGKSHPHSSVGYYIHPRVSKIVADWLSPDRETPAAKRTP